jgi:hypothetical protein
MRVVTVLSLLIGVGSVGCSREKKSPTAPHAQIVPVRVVILERNEGLERKEQSGFTLPTPDGRLVATAPFFKPEGAILRVYFQEDSRGYEAEIRVWNEEIRLAVVELTDTRFHPTSRSSASVEATPGMSIRVPQGARGWDRWPIATGHVLEITKNGEIHYKCTDGEIGFGSAGSPLIAANGQIIGMQTAMIAKYHAAKEYGFYLEDTSTRGIAISYQQIKDALQPR